ncbi:MAG TPA: aminoacyl-tRNA hydrolase [Erysipelothrix sp.]
MKLIVGLGNPGRKYVKTRHNVGFLVIDEIAKRFNLSVNQSKFKADYTEFNYGGEKIVLVKPQTFMNLSGESVVQFVNFYKIDLEDMLVITDDLNLPIGKIRIRKNGSSGGQNGINNIIQHLGTKDFPRLRVGIGKDPRIETVDYVLGKLSGDEAIEKAADAVEAFIEGNTIENVMNGFN